MNKVFFIIAGGTGGHIIPALSVYQAIKKTKNCDAYFICRKKDLQIVEQLKSIKYNILFLPGRGLKRKLVLSNLISLIYVLYGIIISFFWNLKLKPSAILSFGGYLSFPVLTTGMLMRIPMFLFEQNSYPGVVNRIFKNRARIVFVNFRYTRRFFKNSFVVGNPLRETLKQKLSADKCYKFFNFKNKDVILVMGGSQGALKINQVFSKIVEKLKNFNIIWITGKSHFNKFKSKQMDGRIYITPYLKEMEYAYNITKLAIARAGALTITELAYFGIPAIFVPLPISAENHQLINAKIVQEAGGGIVIEEKNLNPEILFQNISQIFKNRRLLKEMGNNIKRVYIPDSTAKIMKKIKQEIE